jgi:hypothetical protein
VSVAARASGLSRPTVYRGLAELDGVVDTAVVGPDRVRAPGGGRKRATDTDPRLLVGRPGNSGQAFSGLNHAARCPFRYSL